MGVASDRYEIRELLGAGSMGKVFRAFDREAGREVALKTLRSADPEELYHLKLEFRTLAEVSHRHLVQLFDLEVEGELGFFTMELIRGRDFLAHARGDGTDPARLRDAFAGLVEGLAALHARGILHRDVKPGNVLVEEGGRVVLLDFGLALAMQRTLRTANQEGFAGTLLYTSPEQAWGQPVGPAADWYGAGVMLYEALTGRLPFEEPGFASLLERRSRAPRAPTDLVPDAPEDLSRLALDLLAYEPERRPRAEELRGRLRAAAASPSAAGPATPSSAFVGRARELEALQDAFAAMRAGETVVVRVEGPSGIGKTTLVERFLDEVGAGDEALVLRSRCHPRESVRFEAVDGLVDGLSEFLLAQPADRLEALRPRWVRALVRIFPVLGRVPFDVPASEPDPSEVDPIEVRRRGFGALREILTRVADRRPLVLWVDDLQWGDLDSAPLARELLRPPDPPALLLLANVRSEDAGASPLLGALGEAEAEGALGEVRTIALGPLSGDETDRLLEGLLAGAGPGVLAPARALAREAGGSPFLVAELARFLAERGSDLPAPEVLDLRAAVGERIRALPDDARDLLELVAVAGRPIETRVVLDAAEGGGGRPRLYELCNGCLLRPVPPGDRLETYHARLREAVLHDIDAPALRRRHRQLAEGLAPAPGADPAVVLEHWLGAGDEKAAAPWALSAAESADRSLAFDRAAELYALALELRGRPDADWDLVQRRARSLANAGRGSAAARTYESAADAARRAGQAEPVPSVLRGRAAEQHFYAEELDEGMAMLVDVARDLGVPLPRSPRARVAASLLARLRFLLRGDHLRTRPASAIPEATLARLDVLHGAAKGTAMLDQTLGDLLGVRHLLAALEVGEPSRALRALAFEAGVEANVGGRWLVARSERLLSHAAELAEFTQDPFDAAWVESCRSNAAWFRGRWRACLEHGDRSVAMLRERCIGASFLMATVHGFTLSALVQLGRLRELTARLPELVADARERGDLYALRVYRAGDSVLSPLAVDDVARARAEAEFAPAWSRGAFLSRHFYHLMGSTCVDLYAGEGPRAWERIETAWRAVRRAGFLRVDCIGNGLRHLAARAALAAGSEARARGDERTARRLARVADRHSRRIARSTLPHAGALAVGLRAGVAGLRGDRARCSASLEAATAAYAACEMRLYAEAARWQLGRLRGSAEGVAQVRAAEAWMRGEDVRAPARMARMLMPVGGI